MTTTSSFPKCWLHATMPPWFRRPTGTEIHDNRSINGTFVNGSRVDVAVLQDGDVVTIGNIDLVFAGGNLARRDEAGDRHADRRPRRARRDLDDREQQGAAGRHLAGRAARNADGRDRPVRRGQVDIRQAGRGVYPPVDWHGGVRGPQRSRRVRVAAQQDRDGATRRRGARSADRQSSAWGTPPNCDCHRTPPRTTVPRWSPACSKSSR